MVREDCEKPEKQPQVLRLGRRGDLAQDDIARIGFVLPHPSEASIHPTDEDLSVGTPEMGHPFFVLG